MVGCGRGRIPLPLRKGMVTAMRLYRALTISQPWADKIRRGEKFVENRGWASFYRGELAIHAGKGTQYLTEDELAQYTTGAIVAIADMVACLELAELKKQPRDLEIEGTRFTVGQILDHKYTEGPFLHIYDNVRPIEPIPMKGKMGIWFWRTEPEAIKYVELTEVA